MNNLCNENFILILIFVLFAYLLFQINNIKNTSENFGNALNDTALITIEVVNQISNIYQADVQAIRNLSAIAKGLTTGNNTVIPGAITISGQLTTDNATINNLTVTGNINGLNLQTINTSVTSLSEIQNRIMNIQNNIINNQASQQVYNTQASLLAKAQSSQLAASQLVANSQAANIANSQAAVTANLQNNLSLQVGQNYNLQGALTSQIVKDTNIINSETVRNSNEANIMNSQGLKISAQQGAINSETIRNSNEASIMNSQGLQITGQQGIINSETVRNSNEASIMNSQGILISGQQGIINSETVQLNSQQNIINSQASQVYQQNIINSQIFQQNKLLLTTYGMLISIINDIKPWGIYSADNWSNNILNDITGNGNNASTTNNLSSGVGKGFGATSDVPYISGTTSSIVTWPVGSIPTNFTIASVTRYSGGSNSRILSSSPGTNWLQGHHGGNRGSCHYEGWKTSDSKSYGNVLDWAVCIGTNNINIQAPYNIMIDNTPIGTANGGTGGNNYSMTINNNCCGQNSNWVFNQLIIWDKQLTTFQMMIISNGLTQMLNDGMTLNKIFTALKTSSVKGSINNPYNLTDIPNLPSSMDSGYYFFISSSSLTPTLCYVKINYDGGNWLLAYQTTTYKRHQDVNNNPYIPYDINKYLLLQNVTPRRISYNFFNGTSTVNSAKPRDVWVSFDNMVYSPSQTAGANGTGTALTRYDVPYGGSYNIPGTNTPNGFANKYNLVNMNVISASDTNLNTSTPINGRMQVWPSNYGGGNTLNCNNYCYDNSSYGTDPNHGIFQIHSMTSYNNLSTSNNPFPIFGWCHHRNDGGPEMGIGPPPNGATDYTYYNGTADNFKLQIYVKI